MIWARSQNKKKASAKNPFRRNPKGRESRVRRRMTQKNTIQESLKANKLGYVIALDREKWKKALKKTFIGRENPLLSESS